MTFTFIIIIAPQTFFPGLASFRIALLTAAVAIITYSVDRYANHQPLTLWGREMRVTACLVGWAVLTIPFSYWPGGSVALLLDQYYKTLVIFWLLSNVVNTLRRLRLIMWGLSLMAVQPAPPA